MTKKVLITGGKGFIAQSLLEALQEDCDIDCFGRQQLDLLDTQSVEKLIKNNKYDVVIHSATYDAAPAFSTKDPLKVLENNLKMYFNIARCSDYFGKMLYFGSGAEFGRENWIPRMKENYFDVFVPTDQYGLSKYTMTKYTQKSSNIYNLRLFSIVGERDDWRYRFISLACCKAAFDMPITFRQNVFFDFLYIDDLVSIVKWFVANKPRYKVYNTCTGMVYDYQTIAEKICEISSKNLEIRAENDGFGTEYSGDNNLLLKELNNYKFASSDEYIRKLYNWAIENKNKIDTKKFLY